MKTFTQEQVNAILRLVQWYVPGCTFCRELATHMVRPSGAQYVTWRGTPCCKDHIEQTKALVVESYKRKPKTLVYPTQLAKYAEMLRGVVTHECLDCGKLPCKCVATDC